MSEALIEELDHWVKRGISWVINTGRTEEQLRDALVIRAQSLCPDYVILEETGLYQCHSLVDWEPLGTWNQGRDWAHFLLKRRCARALSHLREFVEQKTRGTYLPRDLRVDEVISETEAEMDRIAAVLDELKANGVEDLSYQRNSIYLRMGHRYYQKGSTLQALARSLGIPTEEVLAAGDNLNDLPMLRREVAGWIWGPPGALPEVKEQIRSEGGRVWDESDGEGLADCLRLIRSGGVL